MKSTKLFALCLILGTAPLAAQSVQVDWDRDAEFTSYETYNWQPGLEIENEIAKKRIVDAINEQFAAKGLQEVEGNGDLHVVVHGSVGTEKRIDATNFGYGGYYGWRGWSRWGGGTTTVNVRDIKVGTMIVDLLDGESDSLVWRAVASGTLKTNPDKAERQIDKAAAKMFKKYPPPQR